MGGGETGIGMSSPGDIKLCGRDGSVALTYPSARLLTELPARLGTGWTGRGVWPAPCSSAHLENPGDATAAEEWQGDVHETTRSPPSSWQATALKTSEISVRLFLLGRRGRALGPSAQYRSSGTCLPVHSACLPRGPE